MDAATRRITFNNTEVTSSFSYAGMGTSRTSAGTVSLVPGTNTLGAYICDTATPANCVTRSATYMVTAAPAPVPPSPVPMDLRAERPGALVAYRAHVHANGGWTQPTRADLETAGTTGESKALQAITIQTGSGYASQVGIAYRAYVTGDGWGPEVQDGAAAGFQGQGQKSVEAVQARLVGAPAGMRVCYAVYVAPGGWTAEACDGATAGTGGGQAVQAFRARIVPGPEPVLSLMDAGGIADRGQCLTVAVSAGAASECGDLRLVHALPAVRTLNRGRAPVLLYNSQHANPYPLVAASLTLDPAQGVPGQVTAELVLDGRGSRGVQSWSGWAGGTRRMVYSFDGQDLPTGVYPYTLQISAVYGSATRTAQARGELVVVNRNRSPYGAGWWVAGLEQLFTQADGRKLWVGGDGTTRIYARVNDSTWAAPSVSEPDTIRSYTNGQSVQRFARLLSGGTRVVFGSSGYQDSTVNRLGHVTWFGYQTDSPVRLAFIQSPGGATYRFSYGTVAPWPLRLWSVVLESGSERRETTFWPRNGDPRIWEIRSETDGAQASFGYVDTAPTPERVLRRLDRTARAWVHYGYDAAGKVVHSQQDMGVAGEADDVVTRLTPAESRGRAGSAAVLPDSVYTLLDGPRPDTDVLDHARIWLGRFGAPVRMRNAFGSEIVLTRGDSRYPALVTRADYPVLANGTRRTVTATYDARGNVESQTDWSLSRLKDGAMVFATTRYERNEARWPDFVTRVVLPEGESTSVGYDPATGDRRWEQVGTDTLRRVRYEYFPRTDSRAPGLVKAVVTPSGRQEVTYDLRGNVETVRTPGGIVTTLAGDALGRDTLVRSPINSVGAEQRQRTSYDDVRRIVHTETIGPAMNGVPEQRLIADTHFDPEGRVVRVVRRVQPDTMHLDSLVTVMRYDVLGRKVAEVAPRRPGTPELKDSTVYDMAGNAIQVVTRRGHVIQTAFDALNRMVRRTVPAVPYSQRVPDNGISRWWNSIWRDAVYPLFPTGGTGNPGGLTIPEDVAVFGYDEAGNLVRADNLYARIRRSYLPNGLLRGDTLMTRTLADTSAGGSFSQHVYGLEYAYDLNGRRTEIKHPSQLAPSVGQDRAGYTYDLQTGALRTVRDIMGNEFRFAYDLEGQLDTIYRPANLAESFVQDADGQLIQHGVSLGALALRSATFGYDRRGKVITYSDSSTPTEQFTANYSGLGHLVLNSVQLAGTDRITGADVTDSSFETFKLDPLGNTFQDDTRASRWLPNNSNTSSDMRLFRYEPGTGRLVQVNYGSHRDTTYYDAAGNVEMALQIGATSGPMRDQISYYRADGKLHAADVRWVDSGTQLRPRRGYTAEEYRYDALGRRVWVRMRQNCYDANYVSECNLSTVRRMVWDGDHELYEIQMPGRDGSAHLERDVDLPGLPLELDHRDQNGYFGRVAYTHGLGIDQPLSVIRMNFGRNVWSRTYRAWPTFVILPLWDYRGQADEGVFSNGDGKLCISAPDWADSDRCLYLAWPKLWFAYGQPVGIRGSWQGTVMEDKRDGSGLLYRRNRYYDPRVGRFIQEDPIGLAGGMNAYGFANGDPVSYGDPYGLAVCARPELRQRIERTFHVSVAPGGWDRDGCVRNASMVTALGGSRYAPLHSLFLDVVGSPENFHVVNGWFSSATYNAWFSRDWVIRIGQGDYTPGRWFTNENMFYGVLGPGGCSTVYGDNQNVFTFESLLVHEFGHAAEVAAGRRVEPQAPALHVENFWHRLMKEPERCLTPGERG